MSFRGMMLCSAIGLLLASFIAPAKAVPSVAAVDLASSSRAPIIANVHCVYHCWWKHGIYRKCDCAGPGYYRDYYRGYYRPYYPGYYRHYYDEDDYRYRRWRYRREWNW